MRPVVSAILLALMLTACTDPAPRGGGDIVVIGDSVMAWNGTSGASIPDTMAKTLERRVISRAVAGAQFDNASGLAGAVGFDIQRQMPEGRWNWVVMNGGANDLASDCGCGACDAVVDGLISPDATTGAIPAFIRKVRASAGAQVLWMGYYAGSGQGSFAGCRDDLVKLENRIARFAAGQSGVTFADSEDVIDRKDRAQFAGDNTHPSPKGSALIGRYLAEQIARRDPRSQTRR